MSKEFPEVVVLLTVYNRLSVRNTIESVLKQTFKDFQLMIVDNASDDGTYELLEQYSKIDDRVVIIRNKKNMGQTFSLHRGMELAKGKYIARIDADDIMKEDRLEKQYRFLEDNPEYGLCGSWVQLITDDDRLGEVVKTCTTDEGLRVMQRIGCGVYHPAVMMRSSILEQYGLFYDSSLSMAEDYDMWRQILLYAKGLNLGEVLLYYRRGDNNDSAHHQETTFAEAHDVKKRILNEKVDFKWKEILKTIVDIEIKPKKSVIDTGRVLFGYKTYLKDNLPKKSSDYSIILTRIYTYTIGSCLMHNRALWSRFLYSIYLKLRRRRYKKYKRSIA